MLRGGIYRKHVVLRSTTSSAKRWMCFAVKANGIAWEVSIFMTTEEKAV